MPLPTDPLLSSQWYLRNTTAGQLDLNLFAVWNPTEGPAYTGAGVVNFVIGDGFDYTHPDIAPNYDTALDFDFVGGNDLDPFGDPTDLRGTALLGILGGAGNNGGMVGVAFGSELVAYRVEAAGSDTWLTSLASAIINSALAGGAHVTLMGQSFMGQPTSMFGAGYTLVNLNAVDSAIGNAVSGGRGGLGTILVRGAGDGRANAYDVNADHWGNDTRQIIVAAVTETGAVTGYSSAGAPILVSGFGSEGSIVTSDRVGLPGLGPGDFTSGFQGTDAAAAMVAGVVDLMLEANPNLTVRDVQTILANSAVHTGSDIGTAHSGNESVDWGFNGAATWNGGGLHFSNDYGFGLVDARAAVRMAETWQATGANIFGTVTSFLTMLSTPTVIPDGDPTGTTFTGTTATNAPIDRVILTLNFSTSYLSDLEIYVTSPDGTTSKMIADVGTGANFDGVWTFETQAFRGERRDGTWSVRVVDDSGIDVLTVSSIQLSLAGLNTFTDRYIYTNEYSDFLGVSNHLAAVTDTDGGTNTVDASAVTTGSTIRLDGVAGTIDGVATTFVGVEHAIGGDGADTLVGNGIANILVGNRGRDSLTGGLGNDSLFGGTGHDTLDGGAGDNLLTGGIGNDTYVVSSIGDVVVEALDGGTDTVQTALTSFSLASLGNVENLVALGSANTNLTGNTLNNRLTGNTGNNVLNGGSGNDTMLGGAGNDTYIVNAAGDRVIETTTAASVIDAGGIDTVRSAVSFDLDANAGVRFVEHLTLIGVRHINATGNTLDNLLTGNARNNILNGGLGNDTLLGGAGNDTYVVNAVGDQVFETTTINSGIDAGGVDTIQSSISFNLNSSVGTRFVERLTLIGAGNMTGVGNSLANLVVGNNNNNTLNGALGNDTLTGGAGNDTFLFNSALGVGNIDRITDFSVADDRIKLDDAVFAGLSRGALGANAFASNLTGQATTALQRIIYETDTGRVFFDSDGVGGAAGVQFATLTAGLAVTHADFFVI